MVGFDFCALALNVRLYFPCGISVDETTANILFTTQSGQHVVSLFNPSTQFVQGGIAGTGVPGYSGDGLIATRGALNTPLGLLRKTETNDNGAFSDSLL